MEHQLTTEFLAGIFERWLNEIEQAIDHHDKLTRKRRRGMFEVLERASISIDRGLTDNTLSWTASIPVRLSHQRKMIDLHESGDIPEEAVEKLIQNLDIWAKAIDK